MPPDARIQSSAALGNAMIFVWGSTTLIDPHTSRNILLMRWFHDSIPFSAVLVATTPKARPYGVVQAIDMKKRFLILWNDKRTDSPGVYMQLVDPEVGAVGGEKRFSSTLLNQDIPVTRIKSDLGTMVLWSSQDSAGRIYSVIVDDDGNLTSTERLLGSGSIQQVVSYQALPGLFLVKRTGLPALVTTLQGTITSIPDDRFNRPCYLNADSSMLVVKDSVIRYYKRFYDTLPDRILSFKPAFPQFAPPLNAVSRNSNGEYCITYVKESIYTRSGPDFALRQWWFRLMDTGIAVIKDTVIYSYTGSPDNGVNSDNNSYIITGCDNLTVIHFRYKHWVNVNRYYITTGEIVFMIGPDGTLQTPSDAQDALCHNMHPPSIWRVKSVDTSSVIALPQTNHADTLRYPTAVLRSPEPILTPNVFTRNGDLYVTWSAPLYLIPNQNFLLSKWATVSDTAVPVMSLVPSHSYMGHQSDATIPADGITFVQVADGYRTSGPGFVDYASFLYAYFPDFAASAWSNRFSIRDSKTLNGGGEGQSSSSGPNNAEIRVVSLTQDPNTDVTAVALFNRFSSSYFLYTVQGDSVQMSSTVSIGHDWNNTGKIIPISAREVLLAVDSTGMVFHVINSSVKDTFHIPVYIGTAIYRRLMGDYFLRAYLTDSLRQHLRMEIFSMRGVFVDSLDLNLSRPVSDVSVTVSRDKPLIAVLYSTPTGVYATVTDRKLKVVKDTAGNALHFVPVSATRDTNRSVAGCFKGDTLVAVWQDYRNGVSEVYGTILHLPVGKSAIRIPIPPAFTQLNEIYPNPANASVAVSFQIANASPVTVDVIDVLGNLVRTENWGRVEPGLYRRELDLTALQRGYYLLRMHAGTFAAARQLVIYSR